MAPIGLSMTRKHTIFLVARRREVRDHLHKFKCAFISISGRRSSNSISLKNEVITPYQVHKERGIHLPATKMWL